MRTDTLFGKNVNVVGNVSADLVLESLGKIYIKSRNKALTLDEVISSLMSDSGESIVDKTIIIDGIDKLDEIFVKDGSFIYDKSSSILYLQIEGELVELISVSTQDTRYVKRSGDTMTGTLTINTLAGSPPLRVNSTALNKNFNSHYLNGLPSSAYAQKSKNEDIRGSWQFNNSLYFNYPVYYRENTLHYRDSLHNGSVGTPNFVSGFGGYGWRIDGLTNTLTIDYIVVRKAMYVYELVVNKISATNGSLWVTNASKVDYAYLLKLIHADSMTIWNSIGPKATSSSIDRDIRSVFYDLESNEGIIVVQDDNIPTEEWTKELMASNLGDGIAKSTYNFKDLKVFICKNKDEVSPLLSRLANSELSFTFSEEDFPSTRSEDPNNIWSVYEYYNLFDSYFDTLVVMPIAVTKNGASWDNSAGKVRENVYDIKYVKTYPKYFGLEKVGDSTPTVLLTNLYLVKFDTDNLPVFLPGDILRCLKFTGLGIKYYDAVVCNKLKDSIFIILLASNIMDKTTTITYDNNLEPTTIVDSNGHNTNGLGESSINKDFYNTTGYRSNNILGIVLEGDSLVLIGNLWDVTRQNAVYLTSSDDGAPYIDTISEVNRPDYSVIYYVPTFETIKLYKGQNLPYTGKYYILKETAEGIATGQYAIAYKTDSEGVTHCFSIELNKVPTRIIIWYKDGDNLYRVNFDDLSLFTEELKNRILANPVRILEELIPNASTSLSTTRLTSFAQVRDLIRTTLGPSILGEGEYLYDYDILVLRSYPNEHTSLVTSQEQFDLLLEDGNNLTTESNTNVILETEINNDTIVPTRTTKARFGRLDGIIDDRFTFTKLPHGFGLYGENVFLTGEFVLSNGKNVADFEKDYLMLSSGLELTSITFQNLRLDLINLSISTPSYGNLESAGVFLMEDKLILYGDSVMVVTTEDELSGKSAPTALFTNGKINAKFLAVLDLECLTPLYKTRQDSLGLSNLVVGSVTIDNYLYYGQPYTFRLYQKKEGNIKRTYFVKEFKSTQNNKHAWLYVDIWGNPITTVYSYVETLQTLLYPEEINTLDNVTIESPVHAKYNNKYYIRTESLIWNYASYTTRDSEGEVTYTWDPTTMAIVDFEEDARNLAKEAFEEFQKQLSIPGLWNLYQDGVGNLGGNGLYWDMEGNLTVSGNIEAKSGNIGGFKISLTLLVRNETHYTREYPKVKIGDAFEMYTYSEPAVFPKVATTGKVVLDGNGLRLMNGTESSNATREVYLSNKGLVWRDNKIPFEASSILFTLTVYSLASNVNNLTLPYAKMSYNSIIDYPVIVQSTSSTPFDRVNIYSVNKIVTEGSGVDIHNVLYSGDYFIYFPRLTLELLSPLGPLYSNWIVTALKSGRLVFSVTGLNALSTSEKLINKESYSAAINGELNFGDTVEKPETATAFISSFGFGHTEDHFGNYYTPKFIKELYGQCLFLRPQNPDFPYDVNELGAKLIWSVNNENVSNENLEWYYNNADTNSKSKFEDLYLFGKESNNYDSNNGNDINLDNGIRILVRNGSTPVKGGFILTAHYLQGSGIHNYTQLG